MKQSKIVQVVALAIMGLSGHAMASPAVSPATSTAKATVEFANIMITDHTLNAVKGLKPSGKITGNPVIANGDVKVSSKADIAISPERTLDTYTTSTTNRFKVEGANGNKIELYLSNKAGGGRLAVSAIPDWYDLGNSIEAKYTVNLWDNANVPADVYPITVNAAVYTP